MMPSAVRLKFAAKDRATVVDLLLVFSAIFTITLVTWPRSDSRQVLLVKDNAGIWQSRSLGVNDEELTEIRKVVYHWSHPESNPDYATAKWRLETALHYLAVETEAVEAATTQSSVAQGSEPPSPSDVAAPFARLSDDVAVVSFETVDDGLEGQNVLTADFERQASESNSDDATPASDKASESLAYWNSVVQDAEERIRYYEHRSESLPVSIRGTRSSGWPPVAVNLGVLFGVLAACGYMHWKRLAPAQRETGRNGQPMRVIFRLGTLGGVVVWSLLCCILMIMQA